jgi:hypothetical protein
MWTLPVNIMYYLLGLTLAITPTIWEWRKTKKKPVSFNFVIIITIFLVIIGVIKTIKDSSDNETNTKTLTKLTGDVGKLVHNRKVDSIKNAQFIERLKPIGVTRDSTKNSPVINKKVYIHSISGSTLNF